MIVMQVWLNFILGSTHITEGAIPFAAKDPIRVLPTMMLGSSIAAVLTYLFGVQVPAPHGGFSVTCSDGKNPMGYSDSY